ncbi:hypothetical protein [Tenacibaculum jejuense]|uniref:Uncharacterized protein n=1 Tax=Tenacibaculum jejuense TaxID=584609 RepID=A0A238UH72_9FLAO|nr:hypothetical protein [Tenacibaculum jejuense]SNR17744.1 conserved exported protein of unknown function [Tenacibaculum jejuense]
MKKLVTLIVVTLINFSAFANTEKPTRKTVKADLRTEIVKLLGKADFDYTRNISTNIEFTINNKGEIIVLTVDTDDINVNSYVKNKLNYKVVTSEAKVIGQTYKMPLTILK